MSKPDEREIRVRGGKYHRFMEAFEKGWLAPRTELILEREPDNQYDPNAVKVLVKNLDVEKGLVPADDMMVQVGHVSREHVGKLYWRLDRKAVVVRCTVLNLDVKKQSLTAHLALSGGWKDPALGDEAIAGNKTTTGKFDDLDDDIPF